MLNPDWCTEQRLIIFSLLSPAHLKLVRKSLSCETAKTVLALAEHHVFMQDPIIVKI